MENVDNIIGMVPPVLAAGVVLGTLGIISQMNAPKEASMKDYKIKSLQDVVL